MSREAAYDALFQLLKTLTDFVTAQRRYIKPEAVAQTDMPALFQWQKMEPSEAEKQVHGTPIKTILEVNVFIFVHTTGTEWPSSVMNPIMDKLDVLLKPKTPADRTNTLSGTVQWVYRGQPTYGEHSDGNQMAVHIPIRMLYVP